MDRVIQIANLLPDTKFNNCHRGRVYWAKGVSPCLNCNGGGNREPKFLIICKPPNKHIRYVLGRSNARGGEQGNDTLSFHVNPYFGCVTASRFMNRETWIVDIEPPR